MANVSHAFAFLCPPPLSPCLGMPVTGVAVLVAGTVLWARRQQRTNMQHYKGEAEAEAEATLASDLDMQHVNR